MASGLLGLLYCVRETSDTLYLFSGKMCRAYEKYVSGHGGILVKVAQNRLWLFCILNCFLAAKEQTFFKLEGMLH